MALRVALGLALCPAALASNPTSKSKSSKPYLSTAQLAILAAFLNTLIPADALSPSATQVGVLDNFLLELRDDFSYQKLVQMGCDWIALQTSNAFVDASADARAYVVDWMVKAAPNTLPRRFFELVWDSCLVLYYTRQASWQGSAMSQPPQPRGYPEITDAAR